MRQNITFYLFLVSNLVSFIAVQGIFTLDSGDFTSINCTDLNLECNWGSCENNNCKCLPGYVTHPDSLSYCSFIEKSQLTSFLLTIMVLGLFGGGRIYLCNWDWVYVFNSFLIIEIFIYIISNIIKCCYVLRNEDLPLQKIDKAIKIIDQSTKILQCIGVFCWFSLWMIDIGKFWSNSIPNMCNPMINGTYMYPQPW